MAADEFEMSATAPGFPVEGGLKDVRLMQALAQRSGAALPAAALVRGHLEAVLADGKGGLDWGALALAVRSEAP